MTLRILDLAERDLLAGFDFYERQCIGAGEYFIESLLADIESLRLFAGVHRKAFGFHKMLSRRFPHAIYYRLSRNDVEVWRVLDCRRDPRWIVRQLKIRGL
jgi:plasmid stabilization system protein ParE